MSPTQSTLSHGRYVQELEITVRNSITAPPNLAAFEVEDTDGSRFLVITRVNQATQLQIGNTYRVENTLSVDPSFDEHEVYAEQFDAAAEHDCPRCGGDLTFNTGVESPSPAISEFLDGENRSGCQLVLTVTSQVYNLSSGDDWRPLEQPRANGRRSNRLQKRSTAEYRCANCELTIPDDELEQYLQRDFEAADDSVENADMEAVVDNGPAPTASSASESIGMATGGAKDVDSFRENISEGHLPGEDALTYEGLFYNYYFDTGDDRQGRESLFYPSYSTAVTNHPLTSQTEYYMTVGLNSTLSVKDFERRQLNLVAVLDVSGSMSQQFDQYYYDEHGQRREVEDQTQATKMEAATESLAALTTHLNNDDRFSVVLYNSQAHIAKPLSRIDETDMDAIRGHIREISAGGGTNMSAGLETAIDLLEDYEDADATQVENRLIFMTDMMPNTGSTGRNALSGTVEAAADRGIHTTFVGMGLDVNPDLAESLSKVRGANHYFVHSADEFKQRLDEEFEYMVTPLVFDLQLELDGEIDIESVYGSPNADRTSGRIMSVATLFPSPTSDGETRGGVILLKFTDAPPDDLELVASWEEIDGTVNSDRVEITIEETTPEFFENTGIQKAVCLARYASELRVWMRGARQVAAGDDWQPMDGRQQATDSQWERDSTPLQVSDRYRERFGALQKYIKTTAAAVEDEELEQESDLLEVLKTHEDQSRPDHISRDAIEKLEDLVEFAPTSNGELAEAWGMDSGSEVHAYLTSQLEGYFARDEANRLRPTGKALELIRARS